MTKLCLIGCGGMSRYVHGPSHKKLRAEGLAELAACCDLDGEKAQQYAADFGWARVYMDYREMLEKEHPDGVMIVVPERATCALACAVMRLGYPIAIEKPPGVTAEETEEICRVSGDLRQGCAVFFNRRFCPSILIMKERLQALDYNPAAAHFSCRFERLNRREADFPSTAIHGIDTLQYIAGSPYKEVRIFYQEQPFLGKGVVAYHLQCRFENGATGTLAFLPNGGRMEEVYTAHFPGHRLEAAVDIQRPDGKGYFTHLQEHEVIEHMEAHQLSEQLDYYINGGFYAESAAFAVWLAEREGGTCSSPVTTALQAARIADALRRRAGEICF
ncbi:MAG: Gfo/Idh/MocA family oxidoreductase [Oscillospiraceae bacterium]|jgi:predicted dehydrogenase|nr:Gfo/Idh/MocA family oxidoreductase [Oscillospiraceae bacterium]